MIDDSGGVPERRAYVVGRELRIVGQDLVHRDPVREQADDGRDGDAGAPDAGHAAHDPVVHRDPLERHGLIVAHRTTVSAASTGDG
jgi:hypothetical protein